MRAFARPALYEDAPVVLLNNPVRQRQAETSPLPNFLCRKERVINTGNVLGRNTYPSVSKIDHQRGIDRSSVDRQPSTIRHRITSVQYQIHKHLLKLGCAAVGRLQMLAIGARDLEFCISQLWLQQLERVFKDLVDLNFPELRIAGARKVQQVIHYPGSPNRLNVNLLEQLSFRIAVLHLLQEHLSIRRDPGKWSINFVRDASRQ